MSTETKERNKFQNYKIMLTQKQRTYIKMCIVKSEKQSSEGFNAIFEYVKNKNLTVQPHETDEPLIAYNNQITPEMRKFINLKSAELNTRATEGARFIIQTAMENNYLDTL